METHHQEHPRGVEGGEHHEKKPVLKKVKDKVKKIKDTISKRSHGHGGDEHEHHDNDVSEGEEEGYEEEEEREVDAGVHGAPMYGSAVAGRNLVSRRDENLGPGKVSLGEATGMPVEEDPTVAEKSDKSQLLYPSSATETTAGEGRNFVRDRDENLDPDKVSLRAVSGSEEDPAAPKGRTGTTPAAATERGHPSYSPVKGGDEVGESPLLSSFQAMAVVDKPKGLQDIIETPPTDTHDQFAPEKPQQENPKEETEEQKSSSYSEKISSTAAAAKDVAVSAAIGSTEYGKMIASTVYDKVSGAGTAIMGKGTPESQQDEPKLGQRVQPEKGAADEGVSVKEYLVGKLRPGEDDKALSEIISDAIYSKKQEVAGTPETKGSPSEGGGGMGMADRIKGAVTSWIGAGTAGGPRASPTTNLDTEEKVATTGQTESQKREEKMQ